MNIIVSPLGSSRSTQVNDIVQSTGLIRFSVLLLVIDTLESISIDRI